MKWLTSGLVAFILSAQSSRIESLAPYYATPEPVVDKMLQLGGLRAGETMFDLGSGDGRIVIMAARKYKADATGIEFEEALVKQSMKRIASLGLASTARIIHGDLLKADYSSADLLTVYRSRAGSWRLSCRSNSRQGRESYPTMRSFQAGLS